jgi:hypothetical protein
MAKIAPRKRAGSTIIFSIFYTSSRARGSIRLTVIKAAVIGKITRTVPANKLVIKFAKDGVIIFIKYNFVIKYYCKVVFEYIL